MAISSAGHTNSGEICVHNCEISNAKAHTMFDVNIRREKVLRLFGVTFSSCFIQQSKSMQPDSVTVKHRMSTSYKVFLIR